MKTKVQRILDWRKEREWKKYVNLARSIASMLSKSSGRPYSQMQDIAEYALALELFGRNSWDESKKVKKSTWLYNVVYLHCKQVLTTGKHPCPDYDGCLKVSVREWSKEIPLSQITKEEGLAPEKEAPTPVIEGILMELGEEARALVGILLDAPRDLAEALSLRAPSASRRELRRYIAEELKWDPAVLREAWWEVEQVVGAR